MSCLTDPKFVLHGGISDADSILKRYLAILEVCEAVQIPCPLPVFDLSGKIFPAKKKSG